MASFKILLLRLKTFIPTFFYASEYISEIRLYEWTSTLLLRFVFVRYQSESTLAIFLVLEIPNIAWRIGSLPYLKNVVLGQIFKIIF